MSKAKGIRLIFLVSFLTFSVALFLYASTAFIQNDSDSEGKGSKLSKSATNMAMKNTPNNSTSDIKQLSDVSPEGYADEPTALPYGQPDNEGNVISRGIINRDTYYNENQVQKSVKSSVPVADSTEVKEMEVPQSTQVKANSQEDNDLDLLARLITAEAQGEPYEAKVAVGAVVLNRVKSGVWASTIKEVIYQNINGYYQFTPVVNGWIDKPAQSESIQAAEAAMNGADPTGGAQFYYDDKTTNSWILSKPVSTQIGHMVYAY